MGRLGLQPDHYVEAFQSLSEKPYTERVIMMTHLANSSLPGDALTRQQLDCFAGLQQTLGDNMESSIPASAGLFHKPPIASGWARPGIMLYGSSPFHWQEEGYKAENLGIKAVSTLKARLIAIKDMQKGDNVGYCSQYICPDNMRIGIVSIGYADGYPSNAPNGTPVLVNGQRTTTVGRVSMDMLAIDLSKVGEAAVDDEVIMWGDDLSIDEVAAKTGILSYNLMCSLSPRVQFIYHP
jgi:alanine racemase